MKDDFWQILYGIILIIIGSVLGYLVFPEETLAPMVYSIFMLVIAIYFKMDC